jgi:hypothetical protein
VWLQVANFLVSLVLWLAGRELSGTHVILQGLIALLLILSMQRLSRRVNLAMSINVAIAVALAYAAALAQDELNTLRA